MEENNPHKGQNYSVLNTSTNLEASFFSSSTKDLFIFKKTEKICGAVHLITKFFAENEPLRKSLRECGVEVVSKSLSLINTNNLLNELSTLTLKLLEIKSLLQTSLYSGLISEMNHGIISSEIDNLLSIVDNKRSDTFSLPAGFLEVKMPSPQFVEDKGHLKGHSIGHDSGMSFSSTRENLNKKSTFPTSINSGNSDRTNKILSLLKDGKELTIKDFSHSIKGCSEKTLQRELLRLVSLGKVLKTGERRWSRYSLR